MNQFNWEQFKNNEKVCIHCRTKDEAKRFSKMMDKYRMGWYNLDSYLIRAAFIKYGNKTCYTSRGQYGTESYWKKLGYKILEFSNYFGKENHYPAITITSDGKHTTAIMSKGGKVLKEASVSLYYKNKFSLMTGAQKAVKKLFSKQSKVKEVKRHAKMEKLQTKPQEETNK
jgi:hypothetical protein